jgi:hypothetical protein
VWMTQDTWRAVYGVQCTVYVVRCAVCGAVRCGVRRMVCDDVIFLAFMHGVWLRAVACCCVLLRAVACCCVLLRAVACCWVLLGAVGCCWVLLGAVGCCCVMLRDVA